VTSFSGEIKNNISPWEDKHRDCPKIPFANNLKQLQSNYVEDLNLYVTCTITELEHYDNNIIEKNIYINRMRKAVFRIMEVFT
jgi:hypothetical protein